MPRSSPRAPSVSRATRRRRASFCARTASPYRAGDRLVQPDLAATLALIAEQGPDAFYRGPIAAAVAAAAAAHGGILTKEDFAALHVAEAAPVALRLSRLSWSIRRRRRAPAARFCARCCMSWPAGIWRLLGYRHAADDPSDGRDDAARLCRPQHRVRRPGFRARPAVAPAVARIRRRDPRRDRSRQGDRRRPRSAPARRRTKRPRRRIIRSSMATATRSR